MFGTPAVIQNKLDLDLFLVKKIAEQIWDQTNHKLDAIVDALLVHESLDEVDLYAAAGVERTASAADPAGSTPGPVFDTLSGIDLPWDHIAVFLNDERWVPEDSPRSNTRLLRERLLRGPAHRAGGAARC